MYSTTGRQGWALCGECMAALDAEVGAAPVVGPRHTALCALCPVRP